ncbi:MAG: hypothetical protein WAJ94_02410 [Candidatus Cybelea sp.]
MASTRAADSTRNVCRDALLYIAAGTLFWVPVLASPPLRPLSYARGRTERTLRSGPQLPP